MNQAHDAVPPDGAPEGHDDGPARDGPAPTAAPDAPPLILPTTVSARLRLARESLGLTTAQVAARTRITIRHIEALDRGDLAALPGRPYVLGFVRSFAQVVGLDATAMAAMARAEMDAGVPRPAPRMVHQFDVDDPAKTPSRLITWIALGLFVAVVALGALFWRSYYWPDAVLPPLVVPDSATPAAPVQAAPHTVAAPAIPNGPVVFTARENDIWVKFYDGHGVQLLQKQLAQGESYTVPADAVDPKLWTGRPDALTITIGGQAVPPLADHRGIMRDVAVTAQALLARSQPPAPGAGVPVASASPANDGTGARAPHRRPRMAGAGRDPAPNPTAAAVPLPPAATTTTPPPAPPAVAASTAGTVP
ncbi:RodZ domain-containing protein [Novosphingobium sp.]|uniref:helix-turn-helix domain-containing protein n=1 Tax=Novosphingobium sp. TaxID=1874826 RepID=UPI00333ED056